MWSTPSAAMTRNDADMAIVGHDPKMPLFDSLERDVSSFFVAQGSIFDSILKTLLERLAAVETRVDSGLASIHRLVEDHALTNATSAVVARSDNESKGELEYFVMTLARQLNVVLALLFQPLEQDAVARAHWRQQLLPSISHVLTDNDAILTSVDLSVAHGEKVIYSESHANESTRITLAETSRPSPRTDVEVSTPKKTTVLERVSEMPTLTDNKQAKPSLEENRTTLEPEQVQILEELRAHHRKSTFAMVHQLHFADEHWKRKEDELLRRMHDLLHESHASCQAQCKALHDRNEMVIRDLQLQHDKLTTEWTYLQEKQASLDLMQAQLQDQQQRELDKQLLAFSNTFLASQTTQEQQITRILDTLREFGDRFVVKADLDPLTVNWLQTARDQCIYGVDGESLSRVQNDLAELQQLVRGENPSPLLTQLLEEIKDVLELLEKLRRMLEDDNGSLHGAIGSNLMLTLRQLTSQLEDLAFKALADSEMSRQSADFLTKFTRQMELGTASLLEAIERQQEGYQQALSQQQAELELLKLDMQSQKMSDEELRKQLSACPNQEDTLRLVNTLKEQIHASTNDSASRMLETVDDLRSRMAGLPTHDFLEELLHSKADRSEIDRLRLLLASTASNGPGGPSFAKSPTRCLSCDQTLPFAQSRPTSASPQQNQQERPSSASSVSRSRPSSRGPSPTRNAAHPSHHQSMVSLPTYQNHVDHHDHAHKDTEQNRFVSPFTRAMFLVAEHGVPSTHDILRDLAVSIEATKRRRQRLLDQQEQLYPVIEERSLLSFAASPSLTNQRKSVSVAVTGTVDDRKNRIPLRRTTLSDQVVYGPSITSGFLKPKKSIATSSTLGSARRDTFEATSSRPKTAITSEKRTPGGDVIVRAPSTTVVVRPFSEVSQREEPTARRGTRATQLPK